MNTAISLFAGAGGASVGLHSAGYSVALAADINADACSSYSKNLGSSHIWQVDLSYTTEQQLLQRSGLRPGDVDLIVGGPPCQGFSSAGSRDWLDQRNILIRRFVEIVSTIRPTWFVMENVEGLLTAAEGSFFIEATCRLLDAGYWVRAQKVYMEKYGLPQRRKRVVLVGNLEQCPFTFPEPTHFPYGELPLLATQKDLSIIDAIGDLESWPDDKRHAYARPAANEYQLALRRSDTAPLTLHEMKRISSINRDRIQLLGQGDTMRRLPADLQHPSFTRRAFRRVMDGTPTERRGGAPSGLKRLVANQPSLTITSASPTEFVHPHHDRLLTLRECARIQSFPDWYDFHGSSTSIATQIGNAIPPLFMSLLAGHIASTATWQAKSHTEGRWLGIQATRSNGMSPALARMLFALEERAGAFARQP